MSLRLFDLKSWLSIHSVSEITISTLPTFIFDTTDSFLFLNEQITEERKLEIHSQINEFYRAYPFFNEPVLLIPTSGTTSLKLKIVVIKKKNFLQAAHRVNLFLKSRPQDSWLVSLPIHHVAGLSILARAYLQGNNTYYSGKWHPEDFVALIRQQKINYCSLVPTQIFDLVSRRQVAPTALKCVLVGGSALPDTHLQHMKELGWPLLKTFGMTETAAVISTSRDGKYYEPLPGIDVTLDSTRHLAIRSDSLFEGYLEQNTKWQFQPKSTANDFWSTEDRAELISASEKKFQILGRDQNMIKIKGELVNMHLLNTRLNELCVEMGLNQNDFVLHSQTDPRNENELFLLATKSQNEDTLRSIIRYFNHQVLPFERVRWYIQVEEIPRSDLGKVKLGVFTTTAFKEAYFENRKSVL